MPVETIPSRARRPSPRARAFTLVELVIAAVMVAFIAAATTVAVSQLIRARDGAAVRLAAFTRAQAAADRMAQDVETLVRDSDLSAARFLIEPGAPVNTESRLDGMLLFSRTAKRVRSSAGPLGSSPEGGELEVQYRADRAPGTLVSSSSLMRRADPNLDEVIDGGGVVSPVADGVLSITLQASDGVNWFDEWDSDLSGYPHAVRISVVAADDSGRYTAAARRTVAIDRTPLPLAAAAEEEPAATDSGTGTTPTTGGGTGDSGAGSGNSNGNGGGRATGGRGGNGGGNGGNGSGRGTTPSNTTPAGQGSGRTPAPSGSGPSTMPSSGAPSGGAGGRS